MNQSELDVETHRRCQAREKMKSLSCQARENMLPVQSGHDLNESHDESQVLCFVLLKDSFYLPYFVIGSSWALIPFWFKLEHRVLRVFVKFW